MADTKVQDLGVLWGRTLRALSRYQGLDPAANPAALRTLAADARRLLAAGNPYERIRELEAELEDMPRGESSEPVPAPIPPRRGPGRPRKSRPT